MPELPEVQVVVSGLDRLLPGHTIIDFSFDWPKSLPIDAADKDRLIGLKISKVWRLGKVIIIELGDLSLLVHLKLTGQLVYVKAKKRFGAGHPTASLIDALPDKTTRVVFNLSDDARLFFNDLRKFGWIKLTQTNKLRQHQAVASLGPDALTITPARFAKIVSKRHKGIKACLLDQTIVAGCGNIYADESLWMSQINPETLAANLSHFELVSLAKNLKSVLRLSIQKGGSTSRNYLNAQGQPGQYLNFVKVYQRTGQPCKRCGQLIIRKVVAGRGTHCCPTCQKIQ